MWNINVRIQQHEMIGIIKQKTSYLHIARINYKEEILTNRTILHSGDFECYIYPQQEIHIRYKISTISARLLISQN